MALNVSAWAIRKPIASLVLFAMLLPAGWMSFNRLPVANMPDIDVPIVSITVAQSGAAPGEMEEQVTKRVESAVTGLSGVKQVRSTITDGTSVTTVEFTLETQADRAVADVRDAAAGISGDLPEAASEPLVQRIEAEGDAVITYAVSAPGLTIEELSWFIDDTLARELLAVRGVARVERQGGAGRAINVALDPDRLRAFDVTAAEVSAQLQQTNLNKPTGRIVISGQELPIRTVGSARDIEGLANATIVLPGGRKIPLSELGSVTDGSGEVRSSAFFDGQPVVSFGIFRSKGHSDVAVAEGARRQIAALAEMNRGVSFHMIETTTDDIENDYWSAMSTLAEGALLAVLVVFLFLRNVRATLITSLAIPLSILPTFFVMELLGFSLNTFSILAITLVTGILVDDAIVEIENIERHIQMGKPPYNAAIVAADEIGLAVVATTAAIAAVFVPVAFMSGIVGQFFRQFGLTVAVAVAFSLLVARLITPILAAHFLRGAPYTERPDGWLLRIYTRAMTWALRWRFITVSAGLAFFAASIVLATVLPPAFLPTEDKGRSLLQIELPPGSTLQQTEQTVTAITKILRKSPEVAQVFAKVGGDGETRKADISIGLRPRAERSVTAKQFEQAIKPVLAAVPDTLMSFAGDDFDKDFAVVLTGSDGKSLEQAASRLETEIRAKVPLLRNARALTAVDRPEIQIIPDPDAAAELGVSTDQIAETVRIAAVGDTSGNLAKFSVDGRLIDIRVQLDAGAISDLAMLENLRVRRSDGATVPLLAVAKVQDALGPAAIERSGGRRQIAIEADLAAGASLGEALAAVRALPAATQLPAGITLSESGSAELMGEVFSGFILAMITGLILLLAVLILLFEDVLQPVTILLSLPLSAGGAVVALLLTGHAIGLSVVIGFLMLIGIVTKNAILLVDAAIAEIRKGHSRSEALINAGRKRAQPIIMTTVAMVAGMMPAALALSEGGEIRAPMAVAVIGGLISSTLLSLVFVPALFTIMDDLNRLVRRASAGFIGPDRHAGAPAGG